MGRLWVPLDLLQIVQADTESMKELGLCEFSQGYVVFLAHDSDRAVFIIGHQVREKHSLPELQAPFWDDLHGELGGNLKKPVRTERAGRLGGSNQGRHIQRGDVKPQPMSHPSTATRQRVPAHFAGNGRFLEVCARVKVAGNFLASFKVNRHIFLSARYVIEGSTVSCAFQAAACEVYNICTGFPTQRAPRVLLDWL